MENENFKKYGDIYFPVYIKYLEENAKIEGDSVTIEINEKELFDKIAHYGNEKADQNELEKAIAKINKQPIITTLLYNKTDKSLKTVKTTEKIPQWTRYLTQAVHGCFQEYPDYPKLSFQN